MEGGGGWWREVGAEGGRGKLREGWGLVEGGGWSREGEAEG